MTARATAERHAQDVVDGNMNRILGDLAGSSFTQLIGTGGPPQPTTSWEILSESASDDAVGFHVRYANDTGDALELQTTCKQFDGGVWKIVNAKKAQS